MDFSEEWKSLWPINTVFSPPLLLPSKSEEIGSGGRNEPTPTSKSDEIGPLIFNPTPATLTQLFSSPSLSPHLPPAFPSLSSAKFLQTSTFSLLPSTANLISSSQLSSSDYINLSPPQFHHNCLQLLPCPNTNWVFAFFPTGPNSNQVGFILLNVNDSVLDVKSAFGKVFTAKNELGHQIIQLLVNPLTDSCSFSATCIGFLLAVTMYSVSLYSAGVRGDSSSMQPVVGFLGSKLFSSAVAHACWSPHLPEECLVLLENGDMFLFDFDMNSSSRSRSLTLPVKGRKLKVSWDGYLTDNVFEKGSNWLSCEFSWHPRVLFVAHSSAVFLVDVRSEGCKVSSLVTISAISSFENNRFVALSRAGSDGFYFTVASNYELLLCDLRKPLMPILRWAHGIGNPCYISVFRLSELRSLSKDDIFGWASETGYAILVGSFWNSEFSLFFYGPDNRKGSVVSDDILTFCSKSESFYAWGLPSGLSLASRDCHCGSCLVKEELFKDALPEWVDWRQKKEIILGFGILDKNLFAQLHKPDDGHGGFMLIRLTSSGKLESQRYHASWEYEKPLGDAHNELSLPFEDSLLYAMGEWEFKSPKIFQYLKLDWLNGYLNFTLAKTLAKELDRPHDSLHRKLSFRSAFHENICGKLKAFKNRLGLQASPEVQDLFMDISLPTSIYEIALTSVCARLPTDLLRMGFSPYSELLQLLVKPKKVHLEFLEVPHQPHLPPFCVRKPSFRSSKWSKQQQPGNGLVGLVVPLPFLVTVHKIQTVEADNLSADSEIILECNEVIKVANEGTLPDADSQLYDGHAVSLADDKDNICYSSSNLKLFSKYQPVALLENSVREDKRHTNLIFITTRKDRVSNAKVQMDGEELFASECPLKFNSDAIDFGPEELEGYKLLKEQYSHFKKELHKDL